MYKQRGMTLIEVLIAGMILFISISAISLVARTKILNQQKLIRATESAYVAEYAVDTIKYQLKYTSNREGQLAIANRDYQWTAHITHSMPPRRVLEESDGVSSNNNDLLLLYTMTISEIESSRATFEFSELVWEMQL